MQEQQLYEYAIIRIVPKVEREEFLNVGVILFCNKQKLLLVKYAINYARLSAFCNAINIEEAETYLNAFNEISQGVNTASAISQLPAAARFRWLTATRSTVVQTSKVHPGFCIDPHITINKLFNDLVY